jgi:hypothetical protein
MSIRANPSYQRIAALTLILIFVLVLLWPSLQNINLLQIDFIQYWAAGYNTLRSKNPYNYEETAELYRTIVHAVPYESFLYPPWIITVILPFSLLPIGISRNLWYILCLGLLIFSSDRIWAFYNGPKRLRWLTLLLALTFSPTILTLTLGQLSPFALTGIILFLITLRASENKPSKLWLAGSVIALLALKPQCFYLFWVALLLWSISKREWRVILGTLITLSVATLVVSFFVPDIFFKFVSTSLKNQPIMYGTPTIGYLLRERIGEKFFLLQMVAPILGIGWLVNSWQRHQGAWDWATRLPILAFVSIITSPYAWTHDQVILLLPLLQLAAWIAISPKYFLLKYFVIGWLVFNIGLVVLHIRYADYWFIWQAPVLMLVYILFQKWLPAPLSPTESF